MVILDLTIETRQENKTTRAPPQPFCAISIKINKLYEAENQLKRLVTPTVAHGKDLGSTSAAFPAHFPGPSTLLRNTTHAKAGRGTST